MARRNGPTDSELESTPREFDDFDPGFEGNELPSARRAMEDTAADSPFLRKQKRVPARKGAVTRKTAERIKLMLIFLGAVAIAAGALLAIRIYAEKASRFRIDSSDQIDVVGNSRVAKAEVVGVFGADIARHIFAVPLDERRAQLESIPWVESATVMRLLPNRIRVQIVERTPVAFVVIDGRTALIDAYGVVMDRPADAKYSFPVIAGMKNEEPLSTRAARMKIFAAVMRDLDSDGANYSQSIDEIDLSDPEDVKVQVREGGVLLHLGGSDYLTRYKTYVTNIAQWRQQAGEVYEVDLRYDKQVVVLRREVAPEPAVEPVAKPPEPVKKPATRKPAWRKRR